MSAPADFAAVLAALWTAHAVGDHWVQTSGQALGKGAAGWPGRACAAHVATLTACKVGALVLVAAVTGVALRPGRDDAPHLGTGAYALDQSWHAAWLFAAALIISAGGAS